MSERKMDSLTILMMVYIMHVPTGDQTMQAETGRGVGLLEREHVCWRLAIKECFSFKLKLKKEFFF